MFQEPGHRLQTLGPRGARRQVPFESWGRGGVQAAAWAWGPGACQFCCEGRMPCRELSEQQAEPVLFLPLCFLQSTEGNLSGLPEDVLHILPKFGRTFQVEGGLDLLAGALALVGGGAEIRPRACGASCETPLMNFWASWGQGPLQGVQVGHNGWFGVAHGLWLLGTPSWPPPHALPKLRWRQGLTSARNWGGLLCLPVW